MLIAHVSDTHLLGNPDARLDDYNTAENLEAVLDALPDHLDVMVLTGDIAEDGHPGAYRIAQSLTRGRAGHTLFVAGNHDDADAMRRVLGGLEDVRVVPLSDEWVIVLVNSKWHAHDAGRITEATLATLQEELGRISANVLLCVHHPPVSPCPNDDCGMVDGMQLVDLLVDSPVRAVLSGHVHQQFDTTRGGIRFLGAPSTFRQLAHGGDPHYTDTREPPACYLVELHDDGTVDCQVVTARR